MFAQDRHQNVHVLTRNENENRKKNSKLLIYENSGTNNNNDKFQIKDSKFKFAESLIRKKIIKNISSKR